MKPDEHSTARLLKRGVTEIQQLNLGGTDHTEHRAPAKFIENV